MLLQSLFVVILALFCIGIDAQDPNLFQPHNTVTTWVQMSNNLYLKARLFSVSFYLRAAYMVDIAMFDATSAFSKELRPFIATNLPSIHSSQHRDPQRIKALSYAAYGVLKHIFGASPAFVDANLLMTQTLGFPIDDTTCIEGSKDPMRIGNCVAQKVIDNRRNDGINEAGDRNGTVGGKKYSDWTQYLPVNFPQTQNGRTQCSELRNVNRWQQLRYGNVIQVWDGAHIGLAKPFALTSGLDFVPHGPPFFGTNTHEQALAELREVVNISGSLGDFQKISGEWIAFNLYPNFVIWIARERNLNIVNTVKLVALHGGAEWDSVVAAWAIKARFDNARPISQVHCILAGQTVTAWKGAYQGVQQYPAEEWQPYGAYDRIGLINRTPGFPDYISGHSTSAGAVFQAYKRYFGNNDNFGFSVTIPKGRSIVEPEITDPSDPKYKKDETDIPNTGPNSIGYSPASPVTLHWNTFTEAANAAADSRKYLGIHFNAASFDGIKVGRMCGDVAFALFSEHLTKEKDAQ